MTRVTSKLQVTIPKRIADRYGIRPGTDIEWLEAGDAIRVLPPPDTAKAAEPRERLELYDASVARQRARQRPVDRASSEPAGRGWTREELYRRGLAD